MPQSKYIEALTEAMTMLARHPKTLFVGQNVVYGGQAMCPTFANIPMDRRIEFPVAEQMQMGFCTGLSLEGYIPICVYPRMDFLLLALDQLVNHLDKIAQLSGFRPKVIIRTAVGSTKPLHPGPQHCQNHVAAFRKMLTTIPVIELDGPSSIVPLYRNALEMPGPVIMVEYGDKYRDN
jgi:pyruvate/2-oxoglutarate/acetoin dehydrogenase E1 component